MTLATPKIKAEFQGKLDPKGQSIAGTWKQLGKTWPLTLTKMAAPDPKPTLWEGKLKAGVSELRIVVQGHEEGRRHLPRHARQPRPGRQGDQDRLT